LALFGYGKNFISAWGRQTQSNHYSYLSNDSLETQVYLLPSQTRLVTNHRVIVITHLRPIDRLVTLLEIQRNDNFHDFCNLYSPVETCALLLQIIC